jgi:histone H3/H4
MGHRKTVKPQDIRETARLRLQRALRSESDDRFSEIHSASIAYDAVNRFPPLDSAKPAAGVQKVLEEVELSRGRR